MKQYILASLALLAVLLSVALLVQRGGGGTSPAVATPPAAGAGPAPAAAPVPSPTANVAFKGMVTQNGAKRMVLWTFKSGVPDEGVKKEEPVLSFYTKNMPIRFSGVRGGSVFLNEGGSGETLITPDSVFPMKDAPRSMGAWIKTTSTGQPAVMSCGAEGPHMRLSLLVSAERKFMFANVGEDFTGITTVNDGRWHLLIATYDGKRGRLYVDGGLDATRDVVLNTTSNGHCEVGSVWGTQGFFTGMINAALVSNYVLSDADIAKLAEKRPTD